MLYREIIAVCSEIHTEQNVEFFNVKPGGASRCVQSVNVMNFHVQFVTQDALCIYTRVS